MYILQGFLLNGTKVDENRRKLICATFFDKFKIFIFFSFFRRKWLKKSSEGTKTNQKQYQVVFEKFANLCSKNRKKNQPPILANIYEISNFFLIF